MQSQRITWVLKNAKAQRILDVGFVGDEDKDAGLHRLLREQNPDSEVHGIDLNEELVKKYNFPNTIVGSFLNMPYENGSFDMVIITEVIEHVLQSVDGFKEISRVLKTGGKLIITSPCAYGFFQLLKHWFLSANPGSRKNYRSYLGNPDHKIFWEPLSLCNILYMNDMEVKEITTRNLALPYLPSVLRNPPLNFWPFNRMGTYLCILAEKK